MKIKGFKADGTVISEFTSGECFTYYSNLWNEDRLYLLVSRMHYDEFHVPKNCLLAVDVSSGDLRVFPDDTRVKKVYCCVNVDDEHTESDVQNGNI